MVGRRVMESPKPPLKQNQSKHSTNGFNIKLIFSKLCPMLGTHHLIDIQKCRNTIIKRRQ
jgi:hypothetical protein